ncbi:MAG: DsbE family thiol:disulfide interchange protein [Alphaproteobacteria bacterium]|nr:DsbE family thiol:disulfide interchange protein [Alphaproteobacteria bacterium]HCP00274.1 DsbE family thiol:disulfide interchange protein [Rhodospirillaceae bacterium]
MRQLIIILPLAVFAALIGLMASLLTDEERNNNLSRLPSPLVGKPAPTISLPAIAANVPGGLSTTDLQGKVSIVNVFASWCTPCLAEHPLITRLATEGARVYGINHRDEAADAITWLRRYGNPYAAIGFDADGRASLEWGVTGVPETFIISADGMIVYKLAGPITPEALDRKILPILRELEGG